MSICDNFIRVGRKLVGISAFTSFSVATAKMPLEIGTSQTLAQKRAKQISNIEYKLQFTLSNSTRESIEGQEQIAFDLQNSSQAVVLDFQPPQKATIKRMAVNSQETAPDIREGHIVVPAKLLQRGRNTVALEFTTGETGFQRRDDFMYTLFVPNKASGTFPSFDQPDLKAKFTLSLRMPLDWTAVSQAPLIAKTREGNTQTVQFGPSLPTSTYLFAFAAGKFEVVTRQVNGREMKMYHRESDKNKVKRNVDAIFDLHAQALSWLEDYTKIPYPFEKFDFVLLPAFPFNGMEHPGSIFYLDKSLLLDESATKKQFLNRANLIAHETSHIWFGDLVTMRWFDDVWLKEVFADFIASKIISPLFPDVPYSLQFFIKSYPAAYSVDRTRGTNPIQQTLKNLNEASSLYGDIIYNKAPIVMRELEKSTGSLAFQEGIQEYLKKYSFKNAQWSDLLETIERHGKQSLHKWNKAWVEEAGRPTIEVTLKEKKQGSYLEVVSSDPQKKKRVWPQAIEVLLGSQCAPIKLNLNRTKVTSKILPSDCKPEFILPSPNEPSYGLFVLNSTTLSYLEKNLETLSDQNLRAVVWVQLWENLLEGRLSMSQFTALAMRALPKETQELTLDFIFKSLTHGYWAFLSNSEREGHSAALEAILWKELRSDHINARVRMLYFNAYRDLFTSEAAWKNLYRVWSGETKIKDVTFAEADWMLMAYNLVLRKPHEASQITKAQLTRLKDPERKNEFQFIMTAAAAHSEPKRDAFFDSLRAAENRKNEPWVGDALYYLHHPLHGTSSKKYVEPSLDLLSEIKQTSGIFFPLKWLQGTLRFHIDAETNAVVAQYLKSHPHLNEGLRLKLLQASDIGTRKWRTHDLQN